MRTLYFYHELEDMFEEQLNDSYETISICGYEYNAGHALRQIDERAFRCGVSDWSSEDFAELYAKDLTESEQEYYDLSANQTVYCRNDELEEND